MTETKLFTVTGLSMLAGVSFLLASGAGTLDGDDSPLYERLGGEGAWKSWSTASSPTSQRMIGSAFVSLIPTCIGFENS